MLQELKDFSWLDRYSFAQLEQIRNAIVARQMPKANALVEEVKQVVAANQNIIQNIDNQIQNIVNMGLSDTYKNEISQWRDWRFKIDQLQQYNVNSPTALDSFRYSFRNCGLDDSLSCEKKLNEWADKFSNIISVIQTNNSSQYQRYQRIQELKHKLSVFKGKCQLLIDNIGHMLYENNFYVYDKIFKQTEYMTKFQKYCNALMLLSGGHMEILERDSWKKLTDDQIIQEIGNRIQAMYNLCCMLIQKRQRYFYFNNNYINNNSISGFSNGHNFSNGYNNEQQQPY